ncbi:YjbH domain-containing protein [Gammaproteobacteria bacterium]|nr:YjbH domain-containing protein [Gammaproteobacteria bacterium]
MKRIYQYIFFNLILSCQLLASNNDYIYKYHDQPSISNYGTIGLLQIPSARFYEEGTLAFGWSANDPYKRGSLIAYPFNWFEASYQYTDIDNALYSAVPEFSGTQSYKDKSFDAKFRLMKEGSLNPGIAIGFRDFAGTGLFSSEYIVLSKRLNHMLDLTMGLGWGKMSGGELSNPLVDLSDRFNKRTGVQNTLGGEFAVDSYFSGPMGIFGGLELFIPNINGLRFLIEYDSTHYDKEGMLDINDPLTISLPKDQESRINFGFTYPVSKNVHVKLGYIKGNTINFGFTIKKSLGKKKDAVKKREPIIKNYNSVVIKRVNSKDDKNLYLSSLKYLAENQLYLQDANVTDDTLSISYAQSKYVSGIKSHGRVADILNDLSPEKIKTFELTYLNGGLGLNTITIDRDSYSRNKESNLYDVAKQNIKIDQVLHARQDYEYNPSTIFPSHFWNIAPTVRQQIGGPDGFYFGEIRLQLNSELLISNTVNFMTEASIGVIDNFDDLKLASDSVIPHVRTDIVSYLKESRKFNINRMQLNHFSNITPNIYTKFSIGMLEMMFGGYGGEFLYRPFNRDYAIGFEAWDVKQRDYKMNLKFLDYRIVTGHVNFYYKEPRSKVILSLKGGRFLAGDSGINVDFHRRFESGLRIGAFFSKTDISKYEFGEGSFDKGFYFQLPLDIFLSNHSKEVTGTGLRPLTRDGAAYLMNTHTLFGVTEQGQAINLTRDWADLYE